MPCFCSFPEGNVKSFMKSKWKNETIAVPEKVFTTEKRRHRDFYANVLRHGINR